MKSNAEIFGIHPNILTYDVTDKKELADCIRNHHKEHTPVELADILNVPVSKIYEAEKAAGVKCIKDLDRLKQIITANQHKTARQIEKLCFYGSARITQVAKILGIALPKGERKVKKGNVYEWNRENDPTLKRLMPRINRMKDVYSQRPSPYGIATELHGIKTQ